MNQNSKPHKINEMPILPSSVVQQNLTSQHIAKGDSDASQPYIAKNGQHLLHSQQKTNGPNMLLPNNQNIKSNTQAHNESSHCLANYPHKQQLQTYCQHFIPLSYP